MTSEMNHEALSNDEREKTEAVEAFVASVRQFCDWADQLEGGFVELKRARELLSDLHFRALRLPEVARAEEVEQAAVGGKTAALPSEESLATHASRYRAARSRFSKLPFEENWDVFDPLDEAKRESSYNSLSDDLADIYCDLREGLDLYEAGRIEDGIWEWRFNFEIHWGRHLVGAQRAIHAYFG